MAVGVDQWATMPQLLDGSSALSESSILSAACDQDHTQHAIEHCTRSGPVRNTSTSRPTNPRSPSPAALDNAEVNLLVNRLAAPITSLHTAVREEIVPQSKHRSKDARQYHGKTMMRSTKQKPKPNTASKGSTPRLMLLPEELGAAVRRAVQKEADLAQRQAGKNTEIVNKAQQRADSEQATCLEDAACELPDWPSIHSDRIQVANSETGAVTSTPDPPKAVQRPQSGRCPPVCAPPPPRARPGPRSAASGPSRRDVADQPPTQGGRGAGNSASAHDDGRDDSEEEDVFDEKAVGSERVRTGVLGGGKVGGRLPRARPQSALATPDGQRARSAAPKPRPKSASNTTAAVEQRRATQALEREKGWVDINSKPAERPAQPVRPARRPQSAPIFHAPPAAPRARPCSALLTPRLPEESGVTRAHTTKPYEYARPASTSNACTADFSRPSCAEQKALPGPSGAGGGGNKAEVANWQQEAHVAKFLREVDERKQHRAEEKKNHMKKEINWMLDHHQGQKKWLRNAMISDPSYDAYLVQYFQVVRVQRAWQAFLFRKHRIGYLEYQERRMKYQGVTGFQRKRAEFHAYRDAYLQTSEEELDREQRQRRGYVRVPESVKDAIGSPPAPPLNESSTKTPLMKSLQVKESRGVAHGTNVRVGQGACAAPGRGREYSESIEAWQPWKSKASRVVL